MDFNKLREINDEIEQISKTYEIFNEDLRLNRSKSARVEFLTTVKYIEKYLKPNDRILDIGAGAGEYSLYFAEKGYKVSAIELADNNIQAFRKKITSKHSINLKQGNAMDLSPYPDKSFDIVLLFGPLYHLHNEADRQKCIAEAKRVCKDNGVIFFAFISNDMVIITEICYNQNFFNGNEYNHDTFKLEDFPFVFFTVEQCRQMLVDGKITIEKEIASDGMSELLAEKINAMDEYSYNQYLKYHFYCCEKPELLGHSNHLLFIGTK
ncbi:MAG: class I SAM-dependent methyltransferase [Firmicutes bacterium HGW-Firmicutes-21]|nr:MAG: class I SAM-dependent methyltransferase [Firmicutes bacterium HGW-Firmicutes-21]